jgi:hypothetical protein
MVKEALDNHVEICELKLSLVILKLYLFKLIMFSFKFFNVTTLDFISIICHAPQLDITFVTGNHGKVGIVIPKKYLTTTPKPSSAI